MRLRFLATALAAAMIVVCAAAACGQKGPLYLPGRSKDAPWPAPPGSPAQADLPASHPAPPSEQQDTKK
ncbi:MAG TPA: lipoprotein [Burkholderiaceae bacterium]